MNKKELRYSFLTVINAAESKRCEELHHTPSQRHKSGELCPVEYELQKHANNLREYMKQQSI